MEDEAFQIHGIGKHRLAEAPTFNQISQIFNQIVTGRTVVVYNAGFDTERLAQTAKARGIEQMPEGD